MFYVFHNDRTIYAGSPEGFAEELHNGPGAKELIEDTKRDGHYEFNDKTAGKWEFVYRSDDKDITWCNRFKMWAHEADYMELTYDCKGCDGCIYRELVNEADAPAFEKTMNEKMMDEPFMGEVPGCFGGPGLNP